MFSDFSSGVFSGGTNLLVLPEGGKASWFSLLEETLQRQPRDGSACFQQFMQLHQLYSDFQAFARHGAALVASSYVTRHVAEHRAVSTMPVGGVAGGTKYFLGDAVFKVSPSDTGKLIYGSNYRALKAAAHELKAASAITFAEAPGIRVPYSVVADVWGFRVLVSILLPLGPDSLVHGSKDGGNTVVNAADSRPQLEALSKVLNLQPHLVGPASSPTRVNFSVDVEAHELRHHGSSPVLYLLDLARLMPPEAPHGIASPSNSKTGQRKAVFSCLLRHWRLQRFRQPLNADALTLFCTDAEEAAQAAAAVEGCSKGIPQALKALGHDLMAWWLSLTAAASATSAGIPTRAPPSLCMCLTAIANSVAPQVPWQHCFFHTPSTTPCVDLTWSAVLHEHGCNSRHLPQLRAILEGLEKRQSLAHRPLSRCVVAELWARALKGWLRNRMRWAALHPASSHTSSIFPASTITQCIQALLQALSSSFSSPSSSSSSSSSSKWNDVMAMGAAMFGDDACRAEDLTTVLSASVRHRIVQWAAARCGVVLDSAMAAVAVGGGTLQGTADNDGVGSPHCRVLQLEPVIRRSGWALCCEALAELHCCCEGGEEGQPFVGQQRSLLRVVATCGAAWGKDPGQPLLAALINFTLTTLQRHMQSRKPSALSGRGAGAEPASLPNTPAELHNLMDAALSKLRQECSQTTRSGGVTSDGKCEAEETKDESMELLQLMKQFWAKFAVPRGPDSEPVWQSKGDRDSPTGLGFVVTRSLEDVSTPRYDVWQGTEEEGGDGQGSGSELGYVAEELQATTSGIDTAGTGEGDMEGTAEGTTTAAAAASAFWSK